ncbi:MAG: nitroreductase family protein [Deltaproteobacteria bacterium]|nr:MAG: nitroreductase family protein [Deltaproteobacteria bacterium]
MADFVPLSNFYRGYPEGEARQRARDFLEEMARRRTVRDFSDRPVPRDIIEACLKTAATAPSGANIQPWHFVCVHDPAVKRKIHEEAEKVEHEFYTSEATRKWVEALRELNVGPQKPFLLKAPYLIVIFARLYGLLPNGEKKKYYYVKESIGIATGMLITALHHAGLVTLTYTPYKMKFLNEILSRPVNEKPFMILVAGYPAENAVVPNIKRKPFDEVATFV